VANDFGDQVAFHVENYGDSPLARKFGVVRYPAIFVDDVLVATPKDFGFFGKGEGPDEGRYAPLESASSHERFRADLSRMIRLILAGRPAEARALAAPAGGGNVARLPEMALTDLQGRPVTREELAGKVVVVEFWATWCPPCRGTLPFLGELSRRYGDRLAVLALAVESDADEVLKVASSLNLPLRWALGTTDAVRALGGVSAVPTLLVFDRDGRDAGAYFGAPPTLHADLEAKLAALLAEARPADRP
jgi:thiol-disulfide isomerase/thioredoxin